MTRRLVIISPCRDEARFVGLTLDSVVKQTCRPVLWIIVDDGHREQTVAIMAPYANQHPWIKLVQRQRSDARHLRPGVVREISGLRLLPFSGMCHWRQCCSWLSSHTGKTRNLASFLSQIIFGFPAARGHPVLLQTRELHSMQ